MLISLNWLRDFVDLPADVDAQDIAEKLTLKTAEVEGVEQKQCDIAGLIAVEVLGVEPLDGGAGKLYAASLDTGSGEVPTVTQADGLEPGDKVIYAPIGTTLPGVGEVGEREVANRPSKGMIVPGDALGLSTVGQRAVWLPPSTQAGSPIDMAVFNDAIIEIDNKSINHRPDLWGHYGIAREVAAIYGKPLKPYEVVAVEDLNKGELPEIPIVIDDATKCPRYSALRFTGVSPQPAPLWMQARLALVGLRPIDILVDLTNYIMIELGQPMHAFDGAGIDRIEVGIAKSGEKFITLDGVERTMPETALMIQCNRRSIALAGIMGGSDTEVTEQTNNLLLESANFDPSTIRRCANVIGHRTDASARFEKSQDPHNTTLAIRRFVRLAEAELPEMQITSRLSDCFPEPPEPITITVRPDDVNLYVGHPVSVEEMEGILTALQFDVQRSDGQLIVGVPTFRATKDITIEVDVIEEIARYVGYDSIEPALPTVTTRYVEPDQHALLEKRSLQLLCGGLTYAEVHRYIWFDDDWLKAIGYDPGQTITLRNPAAAGMARLRKSLIPGLLAPVDVNRHHFDQFDMVEIGSVYPAIAADDPIKVERRHMGVVAVAPGRKAAQEDALLLRIKTDLETWARQLLGSPLRYRAADAAVPWEHPAKTATVLLGDREIGRVTVVPADLKKTIDDHLAAWSIAVAEVDLSGIVDHQVEVRKLAPVPVYQQTEVDFSTLAPADRSYAEIEKGLSSFDHPLLRRLAFVDSYEGGSVPAGQRSFLFRAVLGDPTRTMTEQDIQGFRELFIKHLGEHGLTLRT